MALHENSTSHVRRCHVGQKMYIVIGLIGVRFRNLSNAGDWIGLKLNYFVADVLAVEVFSTAYLPLDAWPVQHLYVGRVLPDHHKRAMKKGFKIKLDDNRERTLHRYIMQEQVQNPAMSVASTRISRSGTLSWTMMQQPAGPKLDWDEGIVNEEGVNSTSTYIRAATGWPRSISGTITEGSSVEKLVLEGRVIKEY
ncbi:hypothetical protein PIB30_012813 [Stylosanthes scabra]|uniref:Uncharacterized protein n=1 Tax=Stylosanthes scabra TaxID=79078 RepID=A0ABU6U6F5_9FABA|nr:hypothetical protein [Stylosanthes scabra]